PSGVGLALRQLSVAAHVAVLATDDEVDRVLFVAEVLEAADYRGVYPGDAARAQLVSLAVELDLQAALVDEVELLLHLVQVTAGFVARRHHDRVDAESFDTELLADLAGAPALAALV